MYILPSSMNYNLNDLNYTNTFYIRGGSQEGIYNIKIDPPSIVKLDQKDDIILSKGSLVSCSVNLTSFNDKFYINLNEGKSKTSTSSIMGYTGPSNPNINLLPPLNTNWKALSAYSGWGKDRILENAKAIVDNIANVFHSSLGYDIIKDDDLTLQEAKEYLKDPLLMIWHSYTHGVLNGCTLTNGIKVNEKYIKNGSFAGILLGEDKNNQDILTIKVLNELEQDLVNTTEGYIGSNRLLTFINACNSYSKDQMLNHPKFDDIFHYEAWAFSWRSDYYIGFVGTVDKYIGPPFASTFFKYCDYDYWLDLELKDEDKDNYEKVLLIARKAKVESMLQHAIDTRSQYMTHLNAHKLVSISYPKYYRYPTCMYSYIDTNSKYQYKK